MTFQFTTMFAFFDTYKRIWLTVICAAVRTTGYIYIFFNSKLVLRISTDPKFSSG